MSANDSKPPLDLDPLRMTLRCMHSVMQVCDQDSHFHLLGECSDPEARHI